MLRAEIWQSKTAKSHALFSDLSLQSFKATYPDLSLKGQMNQNFNFFFSFEPNVFTVGEI